jgi:hypothetical protein
MSERFPLRPASDWYQRLVDRYGESIPAIERLRIRRGLQEQVESLFHDLDMADPFHACCIHGIDTRSAGFVIINARFGDLATETDKRMCNRVLESARERLSEVCEHCGRHAEIILKIGLEARLADPDVELGDRMLCRECYSKEI